MHVTAFCKYKWHFVSMRFFPSSFRAFSPPHRVSMVIDQPSPRTRSCRSHQAPPSCSSASDSPTGPVQTRPPALGCWKAKPSLAEGGVGSPKAQPLKTRVRHSNQTGKCNPEETMPATQQKRLQFCSP